MGSLVKGDLASNKVILAVKQLMINIPSSTPMKIKTIKVQKKTTLK